VTAILLTCGLGDFVALESHLSPAEREAVTAIHWATRNRESLLALVPFVFPNVADHVIERDTWGAAFTREFSVASRAEFPDLDSAVLDWNVRSIVDDVWHGRRKYHGSTVARTQFANISRLKLPAEYFVVHPFSENARTEVRDLRVEEWMVTRAYIHGRCDARIVIVNKGGERLPHPAGVIDLTNQLTLLEAIEVTKGASGFIGCASVFSVVAAKVLPEDRLFIKGNKYLRKYFHWFYYAPHEGNAFISTDLLKILPNA